MESADVVLPRPFAVRSTTTTRYLHSGLLLSLSVLMLWHLLGVSVSSSLYHVVDDGSVALLQQQQQQHPLRLSSSSSFSSSSTVSASSSSSSPCRAIIDHRGTFSHVEILESLLADFPIDHLPAHCGNAVTVDIYFNVWLPCITCGRITEYMSYANQYVRGKNYVGYQNQIRTLGVVERRLSYTTDHDDDLLAIIYTSAYCRYPFTYEIVHNPKMYAVFHETCDAVRDHPRAYWANPMHPRHIFPNRLPLFDDDDDEVKSEEEEEERVEDDAVDVAADDGAIYDRRRGGSNHYHHNAIAHATGRSLAAVPPSPLPVLPPPPRPQPPVYKFCVIGNTVRRSYHLLEYFYRYKQEQQGQQDAAAGDNGDRFSVELLGRGPIPHELASHRYVQYRLNSFWHYQWHVAKRCDVILGLVDKAEHGDYFFDTGDHTTHASKRKLSGSLPQASAYRIPMVLHEELYDIYRPYLPAHVETHGEDPHGFALAVDRMIAYLDDERNDRRRSRPNNKKKNDDDDDEPRDDNNAAANEAASSARPVQLSPPLPSQEVKEQITTATEATTRRT
jgi:hypothetical protein